MDTNLALQKVIQHEGGFTNNPNDRGGPTKYGITQADMPSRNIREITIDDAIAYYKEHYIKPLYAQINNQVLGEKLVDMGVLFGVGTAVKLLQISLSKGITVVPDGAFGPNTLAAVNERGNVDAYRVVLYNHAMDVVNRNPNDAAFLQGWTNRIQS
jgi:lysozyme family protein